MGIKEKPPAYLRVMAGASLGLAEGRLPAAVQGSARVVCLRLAVTAVWLSAWAVVVAAAGGAA